MKIRKHNCHSRGEGLVIVIIVLAIIGGGTWWLYHHKADMDREARSFGRDIIQQLAVNHDVSLFADHLSPEMKLHYPQSQIDFVKGKLTELGVPQQPLRIEEQVTFTSTFFEPHGTFQVQLIYPSGIGSMQVAVSHPVTKWQVDDLTLTYPH
jgi:hypothetical protein